MSCVPFCVFDTLTMLVDAYDREHVESKVKRHDALAMLKYEMQESGMTQADLGRLLRHRALASLVLNGHRQRTKKSICKRADDFKVSPAFFLSE